MYCTECGNRVANGDRFCQECGSALNSNLEDDPIESQIARFRQQHKDKLNQEYISDDQNNSVTFEETLKQNADGQGMSKGISEAQGRMILASRYRRHMLYGVLWATSGTIVTVITYSLASGGGGTYIIAWGAIAWGIIDFFRGLFGWLKNKN